jgi:hypothetical protein
MTDAVSPTLADLRLAWNRAHELVAQICRQKAAGETLPWGHRLFSHGQSEQLAAARAEEMRLIGEIDRHPDNVAARERLKAWADGR